MLANCENPIPLFFFSIEFILFNLIKEKVFTFLLNFFSKIKKKNNLIYYIVFVYTL